MRKTLSFNVLYFQCTDRVDVVPRVMSTVDIEWPLLPWAFGTLLLAFMLGSPKVFAAAWEYCFNRWRPRPKVVRSLCTRWATVPADIAPAVLNATELRTNGLLMCTCKRWREIAFEARKQDIHRLAFSGKERLRIDDFMLCGLARDCCLLRSVNLYGCCRLGGRSIRALAAACPQLTELRLPTAHDGSCTVVEAVHEADVVCLAKGCCHLTLLRGPCASFGDAALSALGQHCAQLTELKLGQCHDNRVTNRGLCALAAGCRALRIVDVTGGFVSDDHLGQRADGVTDEGLCGLARACRGLTHLNIWCWRNITDAGIETLARHCVNLQELTASRCAGLTDASLRSLAMHIGPRLRSFQWPGDADEGYAASGITDAGLKAFLNSCPQMNDIGSGMLVFKDPNHSHSHGHSHSHHHHG